ncbi:guanine nucleotide-binding protein G(I)/G(S)/G(O) subunit gamma-10 isoform X1 [Monodelphis domestica]|uniref:guanine nucleotide-binding protein G(I)/G(S)/G(O) subunit gamma-10 isoform X1 n=1 Tax=Monodelphis domestica TaxID=13616 RepID=UPI0024E240BF|nr:guanine nucleotide-binding protein G(I)/G(S)/G(O) subunit gamma-10 isoform X1 [Monodelphis domestica]
MTPLLCDFVVGGSPVTEVPPWQLRRFPSDHCRAFSLLPSNSPNPQPLPHPFLPSYFFLPPSPRLGLEPLPHSGDLSEPSGCPGSSTKVALFPGRAARLRVSGRGRPVRVRLHVFCVGPQLASVYPPRRHKSGKAGLVWGRTSPALPWCGCCWSKRASSAVPGSLLSAFLEPSSLRLDLRPLRHLGLSKLVSPEEN